MRPEVATRAIRARAAVGLTHVVLALTSACSTPPATADAGTADVPNVIDVATVDTFTADAPALDAPADTFPVAPHQPFPQIPNQGGPRLDHVALETITFANDPYRADVEAFGSWVVTSAWLNAVGAEYGIGAGTATNVRRTETAPASMTDDDIQTFLANGLLDGSIPRPAGGLANALLMVYLPLHSVSTLPSAWMVSASCTFYGGYHSEAHRAGLDFAYAVVIDCNDGAGSVTELQRIEVVASHELIEAATDPLFFTQPAYKIHANDSTPWWIYGSEVGDLCEFLTAPYTEANFVAQRVWSNATAAAGGDPCVPADPSVPYFGVSVTPNTVQSAQPGATVDYALQGWSTGPVAAWRLSALGGGDFAPVVGFDATMIANGGIGGMSLMIPTGTPPRAHVQIFVTSTMPRSDRHGWPVYVVTQPSAPAPGPGAGPCTLSGIYAITSAARPLFLALSSDGTWSVAVDPTVVDTRAIVHGSYTTSGAMLSFSDDTVRGDACTTAQTGMYGWSLDASCTTLTLHQMAEPCALRASVLDGATLTRQ